MMGLPSSSISATVGRNGPGDNAYERRLARTVFANQRMHLAGAQLERSPAQRVHAVV